MTEKYIKLGRYYKAKGMEIYVPENGDPWTLKKAATKWLKAVQEHNSVAWDFDSVNFLNWFEDNCKSHGLTTKVPVCECCGHAVKKPIP